MQCDLLPHILPPWWTGPLNCEPKQTLSSLSCWSRVFVTAIGKVNKAPGVQPSEFRPYSYCKTGEPGSWNCFKSSLRCQLQEGSRGELRSRSTFQRGLCYSLAFSDQPNMRQSWMACVSSYRSYIQRKFLWFSCSQWEIFLQEVLE